MCLCVLSCLLLFWVSKWGNLYDRGCGTGGGCCIAYWLIASLAKQPCIAARDEESLWTALFHPVCKVPIIITRRRESSKILIFLAIRDNCMLLILPFWHINRNYVSSCKDDPKLHTKAITFSEKKSIFCKSKLNFWPTIHKQVMKRAHKTAALWSHELPF